MILKPLEKQFLQDFYNTRLLLEIFYIMNQHSECCGILCYICQLHYLSYVYQSFFLISYIRKCHCQMCFGLFIFYLLLFLLLF